MGISIDKIISENEFRFGTSDNAVRLRNIYGQNGYKKYVAKQNSVMAKSDLTNPIAKSKEEYTLAKKSDYYAALAQFNKASNVWNEYKSTYNSNLNTLRTQNNGISLTGTQKQSALVGSGDGAVSAFANFNKAQSEVDYRLSLYNDATHSGMNYLS